MEIHTETVITIRTMRLIVTVRVAETQVKFAAKFHGACMESIILCMQHPSMEVAQVAFQVEAASTQADTVTTQVKR